MHLAPFPPSNQLRKVLAAVINQPAPLEARPIFVSARQLQPGARLTVAAAHLSRSGHHASLFILDGPGYRAERLVEVGPLGVAAGIVTLPSTMRPGAWYMAAQDLSQLHATAAHKLSGTVLVDIGVFNVR